VILRAALIFVLLAGMAHAAPTRDFTVADAKTAFRRATGRRLVNFPSASTPDARSLRTHPYRTTRFGTFQLFVLNPSKLARMRRTFTNGVRADRRGIHWVPDRIGGWIAVTVYHRNLLTAWFPPHGSRDVDASWTRLDRAVIRFAPRVSR
jgi:hypothetical protein